jgi:hypothetical protein
MAKITDVINVTLNLERVQVPRQKWEGLDVEFCPNCNFRGEGLDNEQV